MKRSILIFIILLVTGCAAKQQVPVYNPSPDIVVRYYNITQAVLPCIQSGRDDLSFWISGSDEISAWATENKVTVTKGAFWTFNDDTLKFVICHELAHVKLGHLKKVRIVSYATTGVMMVVNAFVPGAGYLNHLINPAVTNNYSKTQELAADKEASKACLCLGLSIEQQVDIMRQIKVLSKENGGGFWDRHPSWEERIENIKGE